MMWFASLPLLLFFALVLIVMGSAVRGAWLSAFVSKKFAAPHCPGCRYEIDQTNPITRCPECGRDLRVAGVLTPELVLRLKGTSGNIWGGVGLVTVVAGVVLGFVGLAVVQGEPELGPWAFLIGLAVPIPIGVWLAAVMHRRRRRILAGSAPREDAGSELRREVVGDVDPG